MSRSCLIIGAGISGLITAHCAKLAGWVPIVFEQQNALPMHPASIPVWANGAEALRSMGLGSFLDHEAFPIEVVDTRKFSGQSLISWRGTSPSAKGETILQGLSLQKLQVKLAEPLIKEGQLHFGKVFVGHTDQEDSFGGVTAHFADGSKVDGAALIGCDGVDSTTRSDLHRLLKFQSTVKFSCSAIQGLSSSASSFGPKHLISFWSPPPGDFRIHAMSTASSTSSNDRTSFTFFISDKTAAEISENKDDLLAVIQSKIESMRESGTLDPLIENIVSGIEKESLSSRDFLMSENLKNWGEGPVSFVGDAAHPIHPELQYGASLAFEDAAALGFQLQRVLPGVAKSQRLALRTYEQERYERWYWAQDRSRDLFRQATPQHTAGEYFRDYSVAAVKKYIDRKMWAHRTYGSFESLPLLK